MSFYKNKDTQLAHDLIQDTPGLLTALIGEPAHLIKENFENLITLLPGLDAVETAEVDWNHLEELLAEAEDYEPMS